MATASIAPEVETYVMLNAPTSAFDSDTRLIVGYDFNTGDGPCRTWLRFDISSITPGSTITSAVLKNTSFMGHDGYVDTTMEAALCSDNTFLSTITYLSAPNASVSGTATGNFSFFNEVNQACDITVTADVISAFGGSNKVSYRLKLTDEVGTANDKGVFLWKNSYSGSRPQLFVTYTPPAAAANSGMFELVR